MSYFVSNALVSMYNIKPVFSLFFFSPIIKNDFLSDFLLCLCPGVGLIIFALEMTNEDLLDYWLIPPWGNASCCCVVYLSFISKGVIITSCFFVLLQRVSIVYCVYFLYLKNDNYFGALVQFWLVDESSS